MPNFTAPVRVQPFTGLVIDVDTWMTAHDYHRRHQQLHLLTLHGSGIACGLEVRPSEPPSDTLIVEPGLAIDDAGNVIIVPERQRVTIEAADSTTYVVLDYVESLPPAAATNGQENRGRTVEDFRLRLATEEPSPPAVELARVRTTSARPLVLVTPGNQSSPGAHELDFRFRPVSYPRAPTTIAITVVSRSADLDPHHTEGLHNLVRELRRMGIRPVLSAPGGADLPASDLLYVTGTGEEAVDSKTLAAIGAQLKGGAWLFADACGPGVGFIEALKGFGGGKKQSAATEAKVLNAGFTFGAAPNGASTTHEISWGENALLSPRDYGCAWAGGHGGQPLSREQIRSALEFGVNVALAALNSRLGCAGI